MKKYLLLTLAVILFTSRAEAQITGSTDVCSGYVYNYSIVVAGAASYPGHFREVGLFYPEPEPLKSMYCAIQM
ncbi:MAG: hypothetical protein IPP51_01665 [Bacteroidetes bacterium]|nr:hypothetical protein [Bacteroidota bacterium]